MTLKDSKGFPLYIPNDLLADVEEYKRMFKFTNRNQAILDLIRFALNEKKDREAYLDDASRDHEKEKKDE